VDRVKNKVAIVTGAANGIGRAVALLSAKEGARVIVSDIDEVNGNKVAGEIVNRGGEAIFIKHDVTSETSWGEVTRAAFERFGKLDVLVNVAGVSFHTSIEETTLEKWRWLMSVNLEGVFLGTKYAAAIMKKSGGGSIINISSAGGIVGTHNAAAYAASKGGVRIFTKAAAIEFSKAGYGYNIRVNSIHPGAIEGTLMSAGLKDTPSVREEMLSWHPIGYFGEPNDIAYAVLYLASDESKFMTGAELVVDGGWTAR
jgi:3(or 17)beta-hydroxysteroid dehydrogenase